MSQRIKYLYEVIDQRANYRELPLLAVSIHRGVVPRATLTNDLPRAEDLSDYKVCKPGDIVLNRMRAFQGAIGISLNDGLVSPDYLVLRPTADVNSRFLHYLFRSKWFIGAMTSRLRGIGNTENGSVRTPRINPDDFGDIRAEIPSIDEQRRISDFLDMEVSRMNRLAELRLGEIASIKERFDSIWYSSIREAGKVTDSLPLRRMLTAITDGPFGSALTSDHYSESGARVIRLGNIGLARFRDDAAAFIPESYYQTLRRHEVREGDLIVAGLGDENYPLGRACVAPRDLGHAIVKADCFRLRLDPAQITHEYAAWALSSPFVTNRVSELSRGSTRQRVNLSVVKEISIPIPSLVGQDQLVNTLAEQRSAVEVITASCHRQVDALTERRQALVTAAVTQQFDVTTASGMS